MIQLLDRIQDDVLRALLFRIYNTFVAVIIPVLAGAIISYFNANKLPLELSSFGDMQMWNVVLGSVIITLLGSVGAGINKAVRVNTDSNVEISDEG